MEMKKWNDYECEDESGCARSQETKAFKEVKPLSFIISDNCHHY